MFTGLIDGGVALVSGAAGGLGCACVFALAEGGASTVILTDLNEHALEGVARESKSFATNTQYQTLCLGVDILSEKNLQSMVDTAIRKFGRIDYFVQAAGIDSRDYEDITRVTISDYDSCLNGNVKGNLLAMKAVASVMKNQDLRTVKGRHGTVREGFRGSIVIVASANAYAPLPNKVAYVTAKHALLGLVKSAALDLAAQHVRVNAICPTWMNTPMFQAEHEKIPEIGNMVKAIVPIGRPAETEEVADVVAFLCSEHASYVTGTGLIVDSGATLTVKMG